jgi:hypothetical protein
MMLPLLWSQRLFCMANGPSHFDFYFYFILFLFSCVSRCLFSLLADFLLRRISYDERTTAGSWLFPALARELPRISGLWV